MKSIRLTSLVDSLLHYDDRSLGLGGPHPPQHAIEVSPSLFLTYCFDLCHVSMVDIVHES